MAVKIDIQAMLSCPKNLAVAEFVVLVQRWFDIKIDIVVAW
ncbi:hypothetical protein [Vibrio vulnificus]|nr:hypothetical protein [Vibrio vulnificus]